MESYLFDLSEYDSDIIKKLVGINDINLTFLAELYQTDLVIRDNKLKFLSDNEELFEKFSKHLNYLLNQDDIDNDIIKHSFLNIDSNDFSIDKVFAYSFSGKPIKAKTLNQVRLIESINKNDLVFAVGPAGTGKTYLTVLKAVKAYKEGMIKKIILTRPAVEAGESLGFLPGDLKEKIDPYLMPLYDSLFDILGSEQTEKLIEKGTIEVLPLAYMRGRTLNDAFIILDEAQNTTAGQMLMFLTRLGHNSKMCVNGDITQIDLNIFKNKSGLVDALEKLKNVKNIDIIEFNNNDIIRNPLVAEIIKRYNQK